MPVDLSATYTTADEKDEAPKAGVSQDGTVDLSGHYATEGQPIKTDTTEKPSTPSLYEKLTAPEDEGARQFGEKHPILGPVVRGLSSMGGTVMGLPGAISHTFSPATEEEKKTYGNAYETKEGIVPRIMLGAERLSGASSVPEAANFYRGKSDIKPSLSGVSSVLPEALGQGAGTVVGAELGGRMIPEAADIAGTVHEKAIAPSIRTAGRAYQKALGVAPKAGAIIGGTEGALHGGMEGAAYGGYVGSRLGKIAQAVLPEGKAVAEYDLGPEAKAAQRLGIDVAKADKAYAKALDDHSKYAPSEAKGPIDPEANPAYKKSLEGVQKAKEAAAEAHYHWQEAKEAARAAEEAKAAPRVPDQPITPEAVAAARPVAPEAAPKSAGMEMHLAGGGGVVRGQTPQLEGIPERPQLTEGMPEVSKAPEAPKGEILPPEKPKGSAMRTLRVGEGGQVVDTETPLERSLREGLEGSKAAKPVAMRPPFAGEEPAAEPKIDLRKTPYTKEYADSLVDNLRKAGEKVSVVGSVKRVGESAHDVDLLASEKDISNITSAMEKQGFKETSGSSVVSPKEAEESGKEFPADQWSRVHHFENEEGRKVEVWHKDTSPKVPKTEPGLLGTEKELKNEGRTPEQLTKVTDVIKDHTDQDLVRLGKKYGVDDKDYDFSARDEKRHRVERDQFVKDVLAKMPGKDIDSISRLSDAWQDKNSTLWSEAERSALSKAQRSRAIMQEHEGGPKEVAGGAPEEKVGTEEGAKEDTAYFAQAQKEKPNASLSEQLQHAQDLKKNKEIADYHNENGGSSLLKTGKVEDGYVVGINKELEHTVDGEKITPEDVKAYRERPDVQKALKDNPKAFIGTWVDGGKTYFDTSVPEPDLEAAKKLGKGNDQKAIFDVKAGKSIVLKEKPKTPAEMTNEEFAEKATKEGGVSGGAPSKKMPTGDELVKKYGEADDPGRIAFLLADGRGVQQEGGMVHDEMLGGHPTDSPARREIFVNNAGAIRMRVHGALGDRQFAMSLPEKGITQAQLDKLTKYAPQLSSGDVYLEVARPMGGYKKIPYGKTDVVSLEKAISDLVPIKEDAKPSKEAAVRKGAEVPAPKESLAKYNNKKNKMKY